MSCASSQVSIVKFKMNGGSILPSWKITTYLSSVSGIHRTFVRQIARSATPSTCDKQGRIVISPSLISYSSIDKEALIIGMINKIEIWNPKILETVDKNNINNDPNEFSALSDKIVI